MSAIDYGNPITSGLFAAYVFTDLNVTNLVSGSDTLTITGDAFLDADGLNCPNSGSFTGAILTSPPAAFKPNDITLMWFGKIMGNGTFNDNPVLAAMYYNNSNTSPFASYGMFRRDPFPKDLYVLYSVAGSLHVLDTSYVINNAGDDLQYGGDYNLIMTRTSGATVGYKNGISFNSDSVAGNLDYDTTATFCINRHITTANQSAFTKVALVFMWNRVLTSGEIADIVANPRFFLRGSDFVASHIVFEGSIDSPLVAAFSDGAGDTNFEGSISGGVATFEGDAAADLDFEGSIGTATLALLGDAAGDFVLEGDITGPETAVPVACISGDGVYTPVTGVGSGGNIVY